ncbi:MAG: hypothetical protein LBR28_03375 [Bacteroidales bacterium]|jgi:hypothetical protein|nr:hypothetical protein [Bacteroidales bacterium]
MKNKIVSIYNKIFENYLQHISTTSIRQNINMENSDTLTKISTTSPNFIATYHNLIGASRKFIGMYRKFIGTYHKFIGTYSADFGKHYNFETKFLK